MSVRARKMWKLGGGMATALVLALAVPRAASAGPFDLEDDDDKSAGKPGANGSSSDPVVRPAPLATIKPHAYTLTECLLLAERNHPNLWAAKARLGVMHGQLDEARWTPFSGWGASAQFGLLAPLGGTPYYNATPYTVLFQGFGDGWQPAIGLGVNGALPLYTFGKIENINKAAEAQVRVGEWELEKSRQTIRMDVRRAFFGLMLARDMQYIAKEVLDRLDKAIENIATKLAAGDPTVEEVDRIRLEYNRDEILARVAEARRGETFANGALRFLTGVQTAFDIPDEPLRRPGTTLAPVVRYLTAARLFRADVNMARAGVAARKAMVDFRRSELFPNLGIGLGFGYSIAPSATPQNTAWIGDPYNRFGMTAGLGIQWGLDLLPKQARLTQAEAQLEEARALERFALGGIAVEVENAYASVVEAKAREETWDRAEHRSRRWISGTQDAIDLGTRDERFLIEPLRAYVFARANHAQALMDLHVALSELARVSGYDAIAPTGT